MYNEDYMYAVDRSDEYLAHYGIKGMRWGVRKAIERGNQRALARQYRKASKKLAKLERQANNGDQYARRASRLRAGAALTGGLAVAGTHNIGSGLKWVSKNGAKALNRLGVSGNITGQISSQGTHLGRQLQRFGKQNTSVAFDNATSNAVRNAYNKNADQLAARGSQLMGENPVMNSANAKAGKDLMLKSSARRAQGNALADQYKTKYTVNNDHLVRAGLGAAALGLGAAAAYNQYRAGHTQQAAAKAKQFRAEMNKAFKGTQYANSPSPRKKVRRRR